MLTNPQKTLDLVIFTEEILNRKLNCLCSVVNKYSYISIANPANPARQCLYLVIFLSFTELLRLRTKYKLKNFPLNNFVTLASTLL